MLGRFVLPVSGSMNSMRALRNSFQSGRDQAWRLSVLAGEDLNATVRTINEFNRKAL